MDGLACVFSFSLTCQALGEVNPIESTPYLCVPLPSSLVLPVTMSGLTYFPNSASECKCQRPEEGIVTGGCEPSSVGVGV